VTGLHRIIGYVVLLGVLVAAMHARSLVRSGREYAPGPYVGAVVALDLQVLIGAVVYVSDRVWDVADTPLLTWVHPVLMVAALAVGHVAVRRARSEQMAADGFATVGRGLLATFVLLVLGVAAASSGVT